MECCDCDSCESNRCTGAFQCFDGGGKSNSDEAAVEAQDKSPLALEEPQAAGNSGRDRGQQVASQVTVTQHAAIAGCYHDGPQPGQRAAGVTAGGSRRQQAPPQAAADSKPQDSGSNKRAKARQSVAGVDVVNSRVAKNRRTSDLSVEKPEMVTLRTGPALEQAERWVDQWDRLQTRSSSRHLRVSTPTEQAAV